MGRGTRRVKIPAGLWASQGHTEEPPLELAQDVTREELDKEGLLAETQGTRATEIIAMPRPQTGYAMWSWSCRERGPDSPRSSVPHCEMPILLGGTWDRGLLLWPRNWQAQMNSPWGDLGSR